MARFRFSQRAEGDLAEIAAFTLRWWGEDQASPYLDGLETCCHLLADNPHMGRSCAEIRPGLRRMAHGRHVVFYRQSAAGVLILRILHHSMLPEKQIIADDAGR